MSERWRPETSELRDPARRSPEKPCDCTGCRLVAELRRLRIERVGLAVRVRRLTDQLAARDAEADALAAENRALRARLRSADACLVFAGATIAMLAVSLLAFWWGQR